MITVNRSIEIDAPAERIWDHLSNFELWGSLWAEKSAFMTIAFRYRLSDGSAAG